MCPPPGVVVVVVVVVVDAVVAVAADSDAEVESVAVVVVVVAFCWLFGNVGIEGLCQVCDCFCDSPSRLVELFWIIGPSINNFQVILINAFCSFAFQVDQNL